MQHFLERISRNDFPRWSTRRTGSTYSARLRYSRAVLEIISGNDVVAMLKDILDKRTKENLCLNFALTNISNLANLNKNVSRKELLCALKSAKITHESAKRFGFKVSKDLWKSCNIMPFNRSGRKPLQDDLKAAIGNNLKSISEISANRTIISTVVTPDGKEKYNKFVRNLNCSLLEAYLKFNQRDQMSYKTFVKYTPKHFKKPLRQTDICDYCEDAREIRKEVFERLARYGFNENIRYSINSVDFLDFLKNYKIKDEDLIKKIRKLAELEFHKEISQRQRKAYNQQIISKELLKNHIIIELDYKSRVQLGYGPRQRNSEFYESKRPVRQILGFGIYHLKKCNLGKDDEIELLNVDIITSRKSSSVNTTICLFRFLREQPFFKKIEKKNYIIWADTGTHFRCNDFANYLFYELSEESISVNLNFFCEKHGKSNRDQHFSAISKFINNYQAKSRLLKSKNIVEAIKQGQKISNLHRKLNLGYETIKTIPLIYPEDRHFSIHSSYVVRNFLLFYNLRSILKTRRNVCVDVELKTSVFSDLNVLMDPILEDKINNKELHPIAEKDYVVKSDLKTRFLSRNGKIRAMLQIEEQRFVPNPTNPLNPKPPRPGPNPTNMNGYCVDEKCKKCQLKELDYNSNDVLNNKKLFGQKKLREELEKHGHPKTRKLNDGSQALTEDQRQELYSHMVKYHN